MIDEPPEKESSLATNGTDQDVLPSPAPLTEEEQMAAFEDALKETDWGHQPC